MQGMSAQIPAGGIVIRIGEDGQPSVDPVVLHLRLDVWTVWLDLACRESAAAQEATDRLLRSDLADPHGLATEDLRAELTSGMAALCAFAFALDGFYDVVQQELGRHPHADLWKKNRTARHRQITETLRYRFKAGPRSTETLRRVLKDLLRFRDSAVHPAATFVPAIPRPDIDRGVHPFQVTFAGNHAVKVRSITLQLFTAFLERARELYPRPSDEKDWIDRAEDVVKPLVARYGVEIDDGNDAASSQPQGS
jgi:hypothetical protein